MTDEQGRPDADHSDADDTDRAHSDRAGSDHVPAADARYARPSGVDGAFAPRPEPEPYVAPPRTVSPAEKAVFGRPDSDLPFAPAPGERIAPRLTENPPVPSIFADAFGATAEAHAGFAPAPGTRLGPSGPAPESPWWKPDALRDPWRDPTSPFWLGRGAVFTGGRPAQLDPSQDAEASDEPPVEETQDEDLEPPGNVRPLRYGLPTLAVVGLIALLAGAIGGLVGWFATNQTDDALHRPDVSIAQVDTPGKRPVGSVAGIAKRVGPAVVSIAVKTENEFAIGSGVVIDKDGDVLTNNHVIAGAVDAKNASIVVTFSNEATAKAQIVGHDPTSDLAVVKVPNQDLTVAQLGNSDQIAVGDAAIAIGSPLGLQGTVTEGIVSATDRPVHAGAEDGSSDAYVSAIQTDAAINPGNSGGALVNSSGAVIGINWAGRFTTPDGLGGQIPVSGIGYAIPINYARQVALDLIHTGKALHANMGVQSRTELSGLLVGAYLVQISPDGPADKAGLRRGDVVVAADGQVIQTADQLIVTVQQHKPGDRIKVTYYRDGTSKKDTATVSLD